MSLCKVVRPYNKITLSDQNSSHSNIKCYLCLRCKTVSMHSNKDSTTTNVSVEEGLFIVFHSNVFFFFYINFLMFYINLIFIQN